MLEKIPTGIVSGGRRTSPEWDRMAAAVNRLSSSTIGSNMAGMHGASLAVTAASQPWKQGIVEIKEKAKDEDGNEIEGQWICRFRWWDKTADEEHPDGQWKTVEKASYHIDTSELGQPVSAGQKLVAFWHFQRGMLVPILSPVKQFLVKNETGKDLEAFSIVGLEQPIHEPGSNEDESDGAGNDKDPDEDFKADRGDMVAVMPAFPDYVEKWAIILEDLKEHEVGPACCSGVCICWVDNRDFPGQTWANIDPGDSDESEDGTYAGNTDTAKALPYGRAEVLWHDPGSEGEVGKWAIVNLGNVSCPPFGVHVLSKSDDSPGSTHAGSWLCEIMMPDNSAADPEAEPIYVYDSLEIGGISVGDYLWVFFSPGTHHYEFLPTGTKPDLYITTSVFDWGETTSRTPPACLGKRLTWNSATGKYDASGEAVELHWAQAPRDAAGVYVRCAGGSIGHYVWAIVRSGRNEIIDGMTWTMMVQLQDEWDYTGAAPTAHAKVYYESEDGTYSVSSNYITVYLTDCPRDLSGNFVHLPPGGLHDVVSVTCKADGRFVVQAPYQVTAVGTVLSTWNYATTVPSCTVKLYKLSSGGYSAVDSSEVTGYYWGLPSDTDGNFLGVPVGPFGGQYPCTDSQQVLVRWNWSQRKWEILALANEQNVWRGKVVSGATISDGTATGVKIVNRGGNDTGVVVYPVAWGLANSTKLKADDSVLVFFLADDCELYFTRPSSSSDEPRRGTLMQRWRKILNLSVPVLLDPLADEAPPVVQDADGWGFGPSADLPIGTEVWCSYLPAAGAMPAGWWFHSSPDAAQIERGKLDAAWVKKAGGNPVDVKQVDLPGQPIVSADGWGFDDGTSLPKDHEVILLAIGGAWYFWADTGGAPGYWRGTLDEAWTGQNDVNVRIINPDGTVNETPTKCKNGWGFNGEKNLAKDAEVWVLEYGGDYWFLAAGGGGVPYRGTLNQAWTHGDGEVVGIAHREVEGDDVDAQGWGFAHGDVVPQDHEVLLFQIGGSWYFTADTSAVIYRGRTRAAAMAHGAAVTVQLLDPPGHADVPAIPWGFQDYTSIPSGSEVWVRQTGAYWYFWADTWRKQVWQGTLLYPWAKPPGGSKLVAIEGGGQSVSAIGYGYESGVSLAAGTEVMVYRTPQGYYFCSAHSPPGDTAYRGKLNVRWLGQQVAVDLQDEAIGGLWQIPCNGWGFQAGQKDLPQNAEVWVSYAGGSYWFWAAGSGGGEEPHQATLDSDYTHGQAAKVGLSFVDTTPHAEGFGWGFANGAKLDKGSEVWAFMVPDGSWLFWADTRGAGIVKRAVMQKDWKHGDGSTVDVITVVGEGDPRTANGWGYLPGSYVHSGAEVWAYDGGGDGWFFYADKWHPMRGKLQVAWSHGDGLKEVKLEDEAAGTPNVQAKGWGYKAGDSLEKYSEVWLACTPAGWRFWSSGSGGGGGPKLFEVTGEGTPTISGDRPPWVMGRELKYDSDQDKYVASGSNAIELYWPGAPQGPDGFLGPSGCVGAPIGRWVWAQERPVVSSGDDDSRWEVIGDIDMTFQAEALIWEYPATVDGETESGCPSADAVIVWYDPGVGGVDGEVSVSTGFVRIYAPIGPKGLNDNGASTGWVEVLSEGGVFTVKIGWSGRWEVVVTPEIYLEFDLHTGWEYDGNVPRATADLYRYDQRKLEKVTYDNQQVEVIAPNLPVDDGGNFVNVGQSGFNRGICRWMRQDRFSTRWEVVSFYNTFHVFQLTGNWTYPTPLSGNIPRMPTAPAKLKYLKANGSYGDGGSVTLHLPNAPTTGAGGEWARVPGGGSKTWGVCMWNGDGWHWEVVSFFTPSQLYRATVNSSGVESCTITLVVAPGVSVTARYWGCSGPLSIGQEVFAMYEAETADWYVVLQPGGQQIEVVTDVSVSGTHLQKTKRTVYVAGAEAEGQPVSYHDGINCPST